jgi:hypothetical protein
LQELPQSGREKSFRAIALLSAKNTETNTPVQELDARAMR